MTAMQDYENKMESDASQLFDYPPRGVELPGGRRWVIHLLGDSYANMRRAPGMVIEDRYFYLNPDPDYRDVYKSGSRKIGKDGNRDVYIDLYSPSKQGLSKFMLEAGVVEVNYQSEMPYGVDQWCWRGQWQGKYTLPSGQEVLLTGDSEFDVRLGVSPRWFEKRQTEIERQVKKATDNWRLDAEGVIRVLANMDSNAKAEIVAIAEEKANQYCIELAQYGRQRAQTGAQLRPIRAFFQIGTYTEWELTHCAFHIQRAVRDYKLAELEMGHLAAQLMETTAALQRSGVRPEVQQTIAGILADQVKIHRQVQSGGFFATPDEDPEDLAQTASGVKGAVGQTASDLFAMKVDKELKGRVEQAIIHYHQWEATDYQQLNARCMALFGHPFRDLTQGEMLLLERGYREAEKIKDLPPEERKEAQATISTTLSACARGKRLWPEDGDEEVVVGGPDEVLEGEFHEEPQEQKDPDPEPEPTGPQNAQQAIGEVYGG